MSLSWFDVVGCCGRVRLQVLALLIAYINMVVCIIYLVLALSLCVLLTTANVAVKKLNSLTAEDAASLVFDVSNSIKQGLTDEFNKISQGTKGTIDDLGNLVLSPEFVGDMNNILEGITGGGGSDTSGSGWRRLLSGQPVKKICRSGQGCTIGTSGSIRDRWEMGVVGIKSLLTLKMTLSNVKKLGLLVGHMLLVAGVWSVLLGVHLAFIVMLVIGLNQESRYLVIAYCIFGAGLLSVLIILFVSHAAICCHFPFIYLLHICLYTYSLIVIAAYAAELKETYVEAYNA